MKKEYINENIKKEVLEKGFSIYNYISLKELLFTINKDYLDAILKLNSLLFVLFLVFSYISFESGDFSILIGFLFATYGFIFIYLVAKLFYRTSKFSQITNILYTKKGLIISNKIFHYEDDYELKELLLSYEKLFDEYLSKPSRLSENIEYMKKNLIEKFSNHFDQVSKIKDKNSGYLLIILLIYSISSFIFYYLGFVLGFLFFLIFSFFINIYFRFNKSIEIKIKENMSFIDDKIKNLNNIYEDLKAKIDTFKDGEISNLSKKMDSELNSFYLNINTILKNKDILKTIISESIYKDFIDFAHLANYIKEQFNKPLIDMITLLEDYERSINRQINSIKSELNSNIIESYQLEQKLINLELIAKNISINLKKLHNSVQ
jgi:hypothetical protein